MRVKTEAKRNEILKAAAAEFGQRGFHETTLAHIAERMNSSKATIYNYFQTKGDLFRTMLSAAAMPAQAALLRPFESSEPLVARLTAFARAYLTMQTGDRSIAVQRLLIAESGKVGGATLAVHDDPALNTWPGLPQVFQEEQRKGALRAGDCEQMARQLLALLYGDLPVRLLFGAHVSVSEAEKEEAAVSAVRMFLAAYGTH